MTREEEYHMKERRDGILVSLIVAPWRRPAWFTAGLGTGAPVFFGLWFALDLAGDRRLR